MQPADRLFVLISGLPGSGKTTVAHALAPLMQLPVIDKDDILERLFEAKGTGDVVWRRTLSRESDVILQSAVTASRGAVVSSFWHITGLPLDSGTPTGWLEALSRTIVNVCCHCPPAVAAERFMRRRRHPGHLDDARPAAEIRAGIEALPPLHQLEVGEPLVVDTTTPISPLELLRRVEGAFDRCRTRRAAEDGG